MQDLNIEDPHTGQRTKSEAVREKCKLHQRQIKKQLAILRNWREKKRQKNRSDNLCFWKGEDSQKRLTVCARVNEKGQRTFQNKETLLIFYFNSHFFSFSYVHLLCYFYLILFLFRSILWFKWTIEHPNVMHLLRRF